MSAEEAPHPKLKELGVILRMSTHVMAPVPTAETVKQEKILLKMIRGHNMFGSTEQERRESEAYCTRPCLRRYLRARKYNIKMAAQMLADSLRWRHKHKPHLIDPDVVENEAVTGKNHTTIQKDKWGRPVLMLDSSVENTKGIKGQMDLLTLNLEHNVHQMTGGVEKQLVFCHLANFSLWHSPSLAQSKKTLNILMGQYPERLGHIILYRAPAAFSWLLGAVKPFVDPVTYSKAVIIKGDVSKGSRNDAILKELIGEQWREITGAEDPPVKSGCAPGYDHAASWAVVKAAFAKRVVTGAAVDACAPVTTEGAAAGAATVTPPTPPLSEDVSK